MESKGFLGGQIPPELVFLAHDQRESSAVFHIAQPGGEAHDGCRAARGVDYAREEFQGGCFPSAVGAEESDEFAGFDAKRNPADGIDRFVFTVKKPANGFPEPLLFLVDAVGFCELVDFNDTHASDYSIQILDCFPKVNHRK